MKDHECDLCGTKFTRKAHLKAGRRSSLESKQQHRMKSGFGKPYQNQYKSVVLPIDSR